MFNQKAGAIIKKINTIYNSFCFTPIYFTKLIFHEFIYTYEPGFSIPCAKTAKRLIHEAYNWSCEQLSSLLRSSVTTIHLTTDLWTAKSRHGYLGVTVTWLSSRDGSVLEKTGPYGLRSMI